MFFLRDILLQAGITQGQVFSSLFAVGRFVYVLILVILVIAILLGLIFINGFKSNLIDLIKQITGLKNAPFGSRIKSSAKDELADLSLEMNNVIDNLEKEIKKDMAQAADEHLHLVEEQSHTGFEQKKIYEEKQKLEYVLSRIKDGVILLSKSRNVVLMNKAAEDLIGYKQYEASGKMISKLLKYYDADREIMPDEYAPVNRMSVSKDEAFVKQHVRFESEQATSKYVDLVCIRLTLIQTQDLGYMIVMHDLSARLEIEKKRTDLLSSFARELKLPLNLFSNLPQDNQMNSGRVMGAVAHLSALQENLLTAADIENSALNITKEPVDLIQLTNSAIAAVQGLAVDKQISIQFAAPDFSAVVSGDSTKLSQVVLNLLFNAITFTLPGGSVSISLEQADNEIILQIQDIGIGIPTDAMKDLFTKFFIVPNEKGLETGIGLGLYISRKLIELHGGKIWLDSVEGRGTIANISLAKTS